MSPLTPEEREQFNARVMARMASVTPIRKDVRAISAIEQMVGEVDLTTAAQKALEWLETNAPPWSATFEISCLRAALKVRK